MATPEAVARAIEHLARLRVLIGIPEASSRSGEAVTNAMLGYIHEFGSPMQNIPARPFLAPGVEGSKEQWTVYLKAAAEKALSASDAGAAEGAISAELTKAGIVAVRAVQTRIRAGIPPPLTRRTVANRRRRSKGSKYRRAATVASQTTPLIDTAQMIRSITYVVERSRRRR